MKPRWGVTVERVLTQRTEAPFSISSSAYNIGEVETRCLSSSVADTVFKSSLGYMGIVS